MAKPKEEEKEAKSDGLEITSIGSLYNGAWDKKYWSCSRGKDRYPYPVGYQAVRAYNGSTYKLEIHEGPKGPLFVITSADEHSCSGQTPDIAWEKFQKKGCPRLKIGHGKRLSCKIDGVEFFGFKNPFVQRLLRELVANVNGTAEQSLLSSSFFSSASKTEHDSRFPDACTDPDLLPYLARPHITGKRSRRREIISTKLVSGGRLKRLRPQDMTCNTEASNLMGRDQRNRSNMILLPPASKEEYDINKHLGALPASGHLQSVVGEENSHFPANNCLQLNSVDFSDNFRENAIAAKKEKKLVGSKYCKSTIVAVKLSREEKALDRSRDTEVEGLHFPMTTEDKSGDAPVARDSVGVNDVDLCVADTLDHMQDNTYDNAPNTSDTSTYSTKEELTAADLVISEGLVTESHPEEVLGTYNSIGSSELSDFDSVGQDIAKSMITVLLPQAIPLLRKASKKKKETVSPSEILPSRVKSQEETGYFVDGPSPVMLIENAHAGREEKMHNRSTDHGSVVQSSEHTKSVVLDSLEDDQCGDLLKNHVVQSSEIAEVDRASCDEDTCPPNTRGQLAIVDVQESSVCHVETSGSKDTFCYNEVLVALNERLQEEDVYITESVVGCTPPSKKVLSKQIKGDCANLDGNSVGIEVHSEEKDLKTAPDCTKAVNTNDANLRGMLSPVQLSQKEISVETGVAETGQMSFTQIPNRVYTRKRVPNKTPLARKYNGPFSESIIFRNFGDDHVPEKDPATDTLPASEIHQISCSDGKPHEKDLFGAKARLGGQSCDLHAEKTTINSKHEELVCASEDRDISNLFDPSVSHVEKSPAQSDKELDEHENLTVSNSSILAQKQGTSFCDNNTSSNKEVQASLDVKPHRILEINSELQGIIELVGCYFHPMPVMSLLLTTRGNETYICVLCGFPMEKNRTLFMYKVAIKEPRIGYPSFVGHTPVTLPISKDSSGREIALERSGLQLTPDGQCLVLLESIRTPYCREGKIHCLCSTCTSDCFEENSLKIVQVKLGFVSVVAKLKTDDSVQCLLVCEPNHLVTVGKSGKMHLWVMNSTWSAQTEEFVMPANNCIFPCIVELKKIPKCAPLVLGHNGFGEFSIWDISKRIFVSRFSAPSTTIYQFFPISFCTWQRKGPLFSYSNVEENINGIMAATKLSFSEHSENHSFLPFEGEDIAIWIIVSTFTDSDAQHDFISRDCQISPVGSWRLALLVKNMVILGSALDPSAAAIGESSGHGIMGTCDGLVYMWELSTGMKLGTLHHFEGGSVSCIATGDSSSGVLAVADDGGQLLVYLHS